jgi:hypothetical protein
VLATDARIMSASVGITDHTAELRPSTYNGRNAAIEPTATPPIDSFTSQEDIMKSKIRNLVLVLVVMLGLLAAFTESHRPTPGPGAVGLPSRRPSAGAATSSPPPFAARAPRSPSTPDDQRLVSNPWYSTKCKVSFNNVPVNTNAYITVRASYFSTSKTVSA